jgi:hypothetical protein
MGGYKESKIFDILKRKSIIIRYIVFIALIFIVTTMLIVQTTKEKETLDIVYTENSNIDYKVYLKENEFFEERYWGKDNQYIANLIDYIEVNFKYELFASEPNVDYKYTYKIVAETNVEDKTSQKSLYKFNEDIIEEKQYEFNTNSKLKINEPIKVDYNRYNDIINRFVDVYDLDNSNATVNVNMYVNVVDDIAEKTIENDTPVMSLSIPLTTQTMAIDIESNSVNGNNINVCQTINSEKYLFIAIILLFVDITLIIKLIIFIKDTKNEKAVYNMRLRKIMSNYGSYIQKLNNEYDFECYQILEIKSFEDLLQVRETINKPILMTEKSSAMETYFFIPSDNNVYVYELKAGNLRKSKGKRYKTKEDIKDEITI